jgi:capsular polysaccharide biosynthesis protein/Mrp family chromosome partitioning ATPase
MPIGRLPERDGLDRPGGTGAGEPAAAAGRPSRTIGQWVRLVARRWRVVAAFVLGGLVIGAIYSLIQPTLYESRSTLVLSPASGTLDPQNAQDLPALAQTVARLAVTDAVLVDARRRYVASAPAGERAERSATATLGWMESHVSASVVPQTSLVEVTGEDSDQQGASDLTRAVVASVREQVQNLAPPPAATDPATTGEPTGTEAAGLRIDPFGDPTRQGQVSPTPTRNLLLGGNVGLILGIIAVILLSDRGLRLRSSAELAEALGVPDVIVLPPRPRAGNGRPRLSARGYTLVADEPGREAFRLLRSRVMAASERGEAVIAMLGSVDPETMREVGAELAAQMTATGSSVLLVEADFHGAPWALGRRPPPGLGEALAGGDWREHVMSLPVQVRTSPSARPVAAPRDLALLPAGQAPLDPSAAFSSPAFGDFIDQVTARYRHVILVGPGSEWQAESVVLAERTSASVVILPSGLQMAQAREVARSPEADAERLIAVCVTEPERAAPRPRPVRARRR